MFVFVTGFQPIMTVVGCVSERTVSTTNLLQSSTPDVSFSGIPASVTTTSKVTSSAAAASLTPTTDFINNSDFKENNDKSIIIRNEVQVWRHSCDTIKVSLAKQDEDANNAEE